jgi:hypothetical protein
MLYAFECARTKRIGANAFVADVVQKKIAFACGNLSSHESDAGECAAITNDGMIKLYYWRAFWNGYARRTLWILEFVIPK